MTPEELDAAYVAAVNDGDLERAAELEVAAGRLDEAERDRRERRTLGGAALWYASQGLHVFPLLPNDKKPHKGTHGCNDATTDADRIHRWWQAHPDSNVGIATGHLVDVFDIDGYGGAVSRVRFWDNVFGVVDIDAIARVSTPRPGGLHLYVPATGDGNGASIAPGIDYRGLGGYVVAPPSHVIERDYRGRYEFLGEPRFGDWLLQSIKGGSNE